MLVMYMGRKFPVTIAELLVGFRIGFHITGEFISRPDDG